MKYKKYFLIATVILILIGAKSMFAVRLIRQQKVLDKSVGAFVEFLENGNIEELRLRVSTWVDSSLPESIRKELEMFVRENETIVDGSTLSLYIELFKELENANLVPVRGRYELSKRWYYVFETESDGILLEIGMFAFSSMSPLEYILEYVFNRDFSSQQSRYIIVNGVVVEDNQIFRNIISPVLPESTVQWLFGND